MTIITNIIVSATAKILAAAIVAVIMLYVPPAHAGERDATTFRDASGNVVGHSRIDSNGVTTFSDRAGFTTGKARTDMNGVTRFYDPSGRVTGQGRP